MEKRRQLDRDAPAPIIKRRRYEDAEVHEDARRGDARREDATRHGDADARHAEATRPEVRRVELEPRRRAERTAHVPRAPETMEALAYMKDVHKSGGRAVVDGPDADEHQAMEAYSAELLKMRQTQEAIRQKTAPMKAQAKELRHQLYAWMVDEDRQIVGIPKGVLDKHNTQLEAAGMPPVPPYIRMFRNNKDATIFPETVHDALDEVTAHEVREILEAAAAAKKPMTVTAAFMQAVVSRVRLAIREYTQQVKLLDALPTGVKAAEVEDAPHEVAVWAVQMHTNEHGARLMERKHKLADAKRKANLKLLKPLVTSFFAHAHTKSRRVVLDGCPYRFSRCVSAPKPKIIFSTIDRALWTALHDAWKLDVPDDLLLGAGASTGSDEEPRRPGGSKKKSQGVDPLKNIETLESMLAKRRADLQNAVIETLSNLPRVQTVEFKLYDVAKPRVKKPE